MGVSRGGLTTKLVALTDRNGRLARFSLHPGNRHESKLLLPLLETVPTAGTLLGDKAYDSGTNRTALHELGYELVIPGTKRHVVPIEYDETAYKARHLVENFFADLKQFRGIACRYCKLADTFNALVCLCGFVVSTRATRRGASPYPV